MATSCTNLRAYCDIPLNMIVTCTIPVLYAKRCPYDMDPRLWTRAKLPDSSLGNAGQLFLFSFLSANEKISLRTGRFSFNCKDPRRKN